MQRPAQDNHVLIQLVDTPDEGLHQAKGDRRVLLDPAQEIFLVYRATLFES